MGNSAIEWTDATWNPVTGCDRVSPGCAHCYALDLAARLKAMGQARYQNDGGKTSGPGFAVTLHEDKLTEPLRWKRPRMVFVNSMSDLFHEEIHDQFIADVFAVMARAERHMFQVLTKRPERMAKLLAGGWFPNEIDGQVGDFVPWPLPNVWLGVSIENRRFVHRADLLRDTPAAVRFISAEPLLGPLVYDSDIGYVGDGWEGERPEHLQGDPYTRCWLDGRDLPELDLDGIDWLIAGGESGPGHRPMRPEWVFDLRNACVSDGVAFFFKQWGGHRPKSNGRELDGRTWDEMPGFVGGGQSDDENAPRPAGAERKELTA